ncbi:MAG: hypothetical protein HYS13_21760 [Planctomycetia bacterium]|nr:hypothetical protein [Planctomycetia bacterium]
MSQPTQPGRLVISLDVPPVSLDLKVSRERANRQNVETIVQLLNQRRLRATIGVPDPESVPEVADWAAAGHEIALLAPSSWASAAAPRPKFSKELAPRLLRANAKGLFVTTLALGAFRLNPNTDLLVKHGVKSVRSLPAKSPARGPIARFFQKPILAQPKSLRFGLCDVPATARVERSSDVGLAWRQVDAAAQAGFAQGGFAHLAIDAAALFAQRGAARRLEGLLRHAERLIGSGLLVAETCRSCAARVRRPVQAVPARSILRIAA